MSVVLDASLTLSWFFEDERTPPVDAILTRVVIDGAHVPGLWRFEVANGLRMAIRRGRIDARFRDRALDRLGRLPILIDGESQDKAWSTVVALSDRFKLTIYDSAYLELARRLSLPLASLDDDLRAAATMLGLPTLGR